MSYVITKHSKDQAKKLGLIIKPSAKQGKKIDVFKEGKLLSSIGDLNYKSYGDYIKEDGLEVANERRRLYKIRHNKNKGVTGRLASAILW